MEIETIKQHLSFGLSSSHCIALYLSLSLCSFFLLCMTAAHQVNSNTNFANFDAFGNTAIPSHLNTSPPSKSLSSGTLHPTITSLPLCPYCLPRNFFFVNYSGIKIFPLIDLLIYCCWLQYKKIVLDV